MGYSLYIERESEKISLEEWKSAVNLTDAAKLDNAEVKAINPTTKDEIIFSGQDGDVAILSKENEWQKSLFFTNGRASFKYNSDLDNSNDPQRQVISKLAKSLNAQIIGDEGEVYDW